MMGVDLLRAPLPMSRCGGSNGWLCFWILWGKMRGLYLTVYADVAQLVEQLIRNE